MAVRIGRDRIAVLAAVAAPLIVTAAPAPVRSSFSNTHAALVLVAVVVAANGDRLAGYLAALSSAVWVDFFLTSPYQSLAITRRSGEPPGGGWRWPTRSARP